MSRTRTTLQFFLSSLTIFSVIFALTNPNAAGASPAAQSGDGLKREYSESTGKVSFISPANGRPMTAQKALDLSPSARVADPARAYVDRFGPEFGLKDPAGELTTLRDDHSEDGRVTVRYQQIYRDIPVMAGELIVNTNEQGDLYSINGEVSPELSLSTNPGLDADQAREIALQSMAKRYQKAEADFIVSEPALWIYDPRLLGPDSGPAALVWRMEVQALDSAAPINELILVDAQRGDISLSFNQIDTAWSSGNVNSDVGRPAQQDEATPTATEISVTETPAPTDAVEPTATPMPTNTEMPADTVTPTVEPDLPTPTVEITPTRVLDNPSVGPGPFYVDGGSGNDSNDCTSTGTPCLTINGAIGKAASGETIYVTAGTYTGSGNQVVLINIAITLSGGWDTSFTTQGGSSVIDGQDTRRGIVVNGGTITVAIDHFTIQNGYNSVQGGGIHTYEATLTLSDSIVTGNSSGWMGGGIFNYGTMTINNTTISGNTGGLSGSGGGGGGGIENYSGTVTLNNSTVSGNNLVGGYSGSGIHTYGTLTLNNSTITGNYGGSGEGIYLFTPTVTLNNSTITSNSGNGITDVAGTVYLRNTILANNDGMDCYNDLGYSGTVVSQGHNLIQTNSGCTLIGSDLTNQNPKLAPLSDNGGPTLTQALYSNSPAINAGNPAVPGSGGDACLATDQRGIARPVDSSCDIGAYEGSIPFVFSSNYSTYTANNGTSLPGAFLCGPSQPLCTNGVNPHADSAHAFAAGTYDLYANKHGRDSIDGNGMTIISTVHYGTGYDNAFWSGSQLVYGDVQAYPMADDIVAHEYTHGVTQYESSLFYYYQSGAIDEALSDLWGEYYDQTNGTGTDTLAVKWLIAEDLAPGGALRSMSNPPAYSDPDKMTHANYYEGDADNGGVHTNNGVNNKAVFLLVDGGTFNGKTVTALGWDKTAAIYYETNTNLLTSGADYLDLYNALYQGCLNLVGGSLGISASNCQEVRDATDAVEMNLQPAANYNTDAPLCGPLQPVNDVFFDDLESGSSNWTFTNGAYTRWQYDSPYGDYAHSGVHFLYADDYPDTVTDATARLVSVAVPAGAYLHFAHAYDFENYTGDPLNYDGGVLEYSTNGGGSWTDAGSLMNFNGYDGAIALGYGNPLAGRQGFARTSHGYISTRLNLSSLAGQNVTFRWRMGLDTGGFRWGWWLDDVRIYTCVQPTFVDVPFDHPFHDYIEALWDAGYTAGCSTNPLTYCPNTVLDRGQAAVFLLRGQLGTGYVPPLPPWPTFQDNWSGDIAYAQKWAQGMWDEGLTAGCQATPVLLYCPTTQLPRVEASVFGLRMMHGVSYVPPPASGTLFGDMTDVNYYGTKWAEQAYLDGLLPSCGTQAGTGKPLFCPNDLLNRAWGAYLIVQAKDLLP